MIVSRNVFHLKFGKAKDAKAVMQDGMKLFKENDISARALMDFTGRFYTLVLEISYESFDDMENALTELSKNEAWQKWYAALTPLVDSGHREMYRVIS